MHLKALGCWNENENKKKQQQQQQYIHSEIKRCDYFIVMFHSGNIQKRMVLLVWCVGQMLCISTNLMPNEVC